MLAWFPLAKGIFKLYTERQAGIIYEADAGRSAAQGEKMGKLRDVFFKNNRLRTVLYGILLGFVCQIYIAPFAYSNHVVSLGTPVLSALLLFQPELPVFPLSLVMAGTACLLRGCIGAAGGRAFMDMFLPALFYYGSYSLLLGICFKLLKRYGRARLMAGMILYMRILLIREG